MHKLVRFWSPKDANITADYYEYGKGAKGPLWQSSHGELAEECQSQDDPPNVATACEAVPEARRRVWNGGVCATWQDFSNSGLLFTQGNLENRIGSHFHLMLRNISAVLWYRISPTDHLQNLSFSPAWCGCTARCSEGCEIWQPVSACLSMSQLSTLSPCHGVVTGDLWTSLAFDRRFRSRTASGLNLWRHVEFTKPNRREDKDWQTRSYRQDKIDTSKVYC